MSNSVVGTSRRSAGWEFRTVRWFVRHPGAVAGGGGLGASLAELGPTVTGGIVGGAVVGTAAWYRGHPDTFDAWAAPVLRAWRRRWAGAYTGRRWVSLMGSCGLTKPHHKNGELLVPRVLRVRSWSASIDTVRVRMVPGQALRAFSAVLPELAATLKAERVAVEQGRPGEVVLIVQRDEPFTQVIPAPEMPESSEAVDLRSLCLGETELGGEWREPLIGTHHLTAGATGAGKNSVVMAKLRAVAPMIRDGLVRPWVCDPKLFEFVALRPILDGRYADTPEDCAELIARFVENMQRKQKRLQRKKKRGLPVSRENPLDWLIVDEVGFLLAYNAEHAHEITSACSVISSMGRATNDILDVYVQEPSKDVVPIRDLLPHRVCLRVTSERHPDMVLGDGARERGAIADEISADESSAGIGFRVDPRSRVPRRVRAAYTSDADVDELVAFVKAGPADGGSGLRAVA
ncbi:cell division protein FtsK [Actinosynnema sp. NPDC047251]|uniref:Cell division protein, FtsK/SpoIIIE family n=1 Tax=Saccharothrix espanaensis (strain ATCC 51144 / DSM 44229 / JCM 9112 / NBRC 15066 / NRRL 15764) TaxID=1179773 RepID=K0KEN0_SACES|nr:cell division protein FtsK [Saccharothrix espanaensis]CCH35224.1 Cell division protein, FtsK/SpoIIIE family [Saccharothrix espanaensis DSM 44229]